MGSVWLRPTKKSRGQAAVTRAQIVSVAVELMDSEGLAELSMRKLAARIGIAPMTLYGHVATKDDVLEYALDGVFAEALANKRTAVGWRDSLDAIGRSTFDAFLAHPWAPSLLGSKPPLGPAAVAHFTSILDVLSGAGFRDDDLMPALSAFYYYILGAATAESAWILAGRPFEDITAADLASLQTLENLDSSSAVRFFADQSTGDPQHRFEGGLARILDSMRP
jgi:AcrR family transcriptional regulator